MSGGKPEGSCRLDFCLRFLAPRILNLPLTTMFFASDLPFSLRDRSLRCSALLTRALLRRTPDVFDCDIRPRSDKALHLLARAELELGA